MSAPSNHSGPLVALLAVHNRLALTQRCIGALQRAARGRELRIVVVDDGSTDGTASWLAAQAGVEVLAGDGHLWFGGATDLGLRHILAHHADCGHVLVLNNDTFVDEDGLEHLARVATDEHTVVAGAFWIEDREVAGSAGFIWRRWGLKDVVITPAWLAANRDGRPEYLRVDAVATALALVPARLLREIALPDPALHPHNRYDALLSARLRRAGAAFRCSSRFVARHRYGPMANRSTVRDMNQKQFLHESFVNRHSIYHVRGNLALIRESAPNPLRAAWAVGRLGAIFVRQILWSSFNSLRQRPVRAPAPAGKSCT